jgi:hypothetical protein
VDVRRGTKGWKELGFGLHQNEDSEINNNSQSYLKIPSDDFLIIV